LKRIISAFMMSVVLVAEFSGCAFNGTVVSNQKEAEQKNVKQTTVTFWSYCATPERDADYKRFGKILNEEHPDIVLDYLGVSGDVQTFQKKLDVAIAAGTAPDFSDYYDSKYIKSGFYEPLDSYFNSWADKDKIDSNTVQMIRNCDGQKKQLYALPFSTQPWGMWVRTDLLRKAGLDIPKTWNQFFAAAQKLTDKSNDQYGIAIRGGFGSANSLEALMYSYSGITDYFDKNGKCTINNSKNVEFVQRYLGLYNKYSAKDDLVKGWTALSASFQAGKAAIIFHNFGSGTSMDAAFSKDITKYEAAMTPISADGKTQVQFVVPRAVAMNSASKVKNQVFTAMTVYCSPQIQVPRCKIQGEVPTHKDGATAPAYIDTGRPYIQLAAQISSGKSGKFMEIPIYLPEYSSIQSAIEPMIQKVMMKNMTAQELLDSWAKMLENAKRNFDSGVQ